MKLNAYRVGGYVRDVLMGIEPKDCDWVVVGHTAKELLSLGFEQVGADFPVFLHPETHEEYALARTERKTMAGYRGFSSTDITLEEDLARRDLTINAMAMSVEGEVIDPYGGIDDLKAQRLRHVNDAFREDPLRILRVARFAARYGFEIDASTLELMREMVEAGEVDSLTPERVWAELWKTLGESRPSIFFHVLRACGALERLFPELAALDGVPQTPEYHPEVDTFVHVMMVVDQAAMLTNDITTRFAALVHDLGKGITPSELWPRHLGHEEAGVALVEGLCERYRAPNVCRRLGALVSALHLKCHKALELKPGTLLRIFEDLDAFRNPRHLDIFVLACEADARGRLGLENRQYPQREYLGECFEVAMRVSAEPILARGFQGEKVGELLRAERILAIKSVKVGWQKRGMSDNTLC